MSQALAYITYMQTTYNVVKGSQYFPDGATTSDGDSFGEYRADGTYAGGMFPALAHRAAVEAAVLRVIATGQAETVVCGEPPVALTMTPAKLDGLCQRCGSYCYGDCRS